MRRILGLDLNVYQVFLSLLHESFFFFYILEGSFAMVYITHVDELRILEVDFPI